MPNTNGSNGTNHSWSSLPQAMEKSVSGLNKTLNSDSWWQAFIDTKAIIEPVTFGVQSTGSNHAVLVSVSPGAKTNVTTGDSSDAAFTLAAQPEQWEKFFGKDPKAPYTSFVGLQVRVVYPTKTDGCARVIHPPNSETGVRGCFVTCSCRIFKLISCVSASGHEHRSRRRRCAR